jgi:hypothetical protein
MADKRGKEKSAKGTAKRVSKKSAAKATATKATANAAPAELIVDDPPPPSPLRGILPTPPEVAELVAQELEGHPVTDREKQRLTDCFKLQYYFGGHPILYRQTDQGKEVVAVGRDEIRRLLRKKMSPAERQTIVLGYPELWQASERSGGH